MKHVIAIALIVFSVTLLAALTLVVVHALGRFLRRKDYKNHENASITSRYAEVEGVELDLEQVPESLRSLIPYAKVWAISDDLERERFASSVTGEEKQKFVDAVMDNIEELRALHKKYEQEIPLPDFVVLFDLMTEAATELSAEDPGS